MMIAEQGTDASVLNDVGAIAEKTAAVCGPGI